MMKFEITKVNQLIQAMGIIVNKTRKFADLALRSDDLTFTQFGVLFTVYQHEGAAMNQRELSVALETDATTIMVVCDALEKKGFLRRSADPGDRRVNRIEICDSGRAAVAKAFPKIIQAFAPAAAQISEGEAEAALPVLNKMLEGVRRADAR